MTFSYINTCGVIQEYKIFFPPWKTASWLKIYIYMTSLALGFRAFFGSCWNVVECLEECVCVCLWSWKCVFRGLDLLKVSLACLSLMQRDFLWNKIHVLMKKGRQSGFGKRICLKYGLVSSPKGSSRNNSSDKGSWLTGGKKHPFRTLSLCRKVRQRIFKGVLGGTVEELLRVWNRFIFPSPQNQKSRGRSQTWSGVSYLGWGEPNVRELCVWESVLFCAVQHHHGGYGLEEKLDQVLLLLDLRFCSEDYLQFSKIAIVISRDMRHVHHYSAFQKYWHLLLFNSFIEDHRSYNWHYELDTD